MLLSASGANELMVCFTLSSKRILPLLIHLLCMYSQCVGSKFVN